MSKENKKKRPYLWACIYGVCLALYAAGTLFDAFVIPRDRVVIDDFNSRTEYTMPGEALPETAGNTSATAETTSAPIEITSAPDETTASSPANTTADEIPADTTASEQPADTSAAPTETEPTETTASEPVITDTSYKSDTISIQISSKRVTDTTVHIADVVIKDLSYLRVGLAEGSFGRNVSAITSRIAEECNAIFAINGDYYGFRNSGFVMRNGYLYRTSARDGSESDALVIYADGSFEVVDEKTSDAEKLQQAGAVQIFTFGPGLVENGELSVDKKSEVERSLASNPRTAIGIVDKLHYIFVVSDGRTDESEGLTLYELANVMRDLGCEIAYNLDGGGSATMWFMGKVINVPTSNGNTIRERSVSDIVYIGE